MEQLFTINTTKIHFIGYNNNISENIARAAWQYAESKKKNKVFVISEIYVTKDGDNALFNVMYNDEDQPKFQRIRRITGYLTGTVNRWNNAKRNELNDRISHIK